jgi:hypothetical protein
MIHASEFRLGNYLLQKINNKISMVPCSYSHFDLLAKGENKDLHPVLLKVELLEKCGFIENKKYALLPDAREFILALPVPGNNKNEIAAYIKNNKECFGRAMVNNLPVSANFYQLHQLQNLYFSLTGQELAIKLK